MNRNTWKKISALLAAIAVFAILFSLLSGQEKVKRVTRTFPVMGTVAGFDLYGPSEEVLNRAADEAQKEIRRLEAICNIYDPGSELSRLNQSAFHSPFHCSGELWEILQYARKYHALSDGAFDVTVGPLMKLWGFHRKRSSLPVQEEIEAAKKLVGLEKVIFGDADRTVRFSVDGIGIDLGGIAKGYALDKARGKVLRCGVNTGILDLGGNLFCLPKPIPGKGRNTYRIGIRDPLNKERIMTAVSMRDAAIATSGNYERYVVINGRQYTHIMDAKTGYPASNMLSVSVIAPKGVDSDALSTSIFLKGAPLAEKIRRENPEIQILIIRRNPENPAQILPERFGGIWKGKITLEAHKPRQPHANRGDAG